MALLAEGIWPCIVIDALAGEVDGKIVARVNVKIADGPSKGRFCTYEDDINAKSSLYISRSLKAVGWQGGPLKNVATDCAKWIKETGGASTVEIKHIELKRGKQYDKWYDGGRVGPPPVWDKPNSIGRGPKPMKEASGEVLNDAEEAMRRAMAEDGASSPPRAADMGGGYDADAPPAGGIDDDIPFITCARVSMGEVLR